MYHCCTTIISRQSPNEAKDLLSHRSTGCFLLRSFFSLCLWPESGDKNQLPQILSVLFIESNSASLSSPLRPRGGICSKKLTFLVLLSNFVVILFAPLIIKWCGFFFADATRVFPLFPWGSRWGLTSSVHQHCRLWPKTWWKKCWWQHLSAPNLLYVLGHVHISWFFFPNANVQIKTDKCE